MADSITEPLRRYAAIGASLGLVSYAAGCALSPSDYGIGQHLLNASIATAGTAAVVSGIAYVSRLGRFFRHQ